MLDCKLQHREVMAASWPSPDSTETDQSSHIWRRQCCVACTCTDQEPTLKSSKVYRKVSRLYCTMPWQWDGDILLEMNLLLVSAHCWAEVKGRSRKCLCSGQISVVRWKQPEHSCAVQTVHDPHQLLQLSNTFQSGGNFVVVLMKGEIIVEESRSTSNT